VCDLYGGESAWMPGSTTRAHRLPGGGGRVAYTWEQRSADPLTGRVVNAIHFELRPSGGRARSIRDAFVYDWRLWGLAELREAIAEAGFSRSDVYARAPDAVDGEGRVHARPLSGAEDVGESYDVLVVARSRSSKRPIIAAAPARGRMK
jgi:hypothetical protein